MVKEFATEWDYRCWLGLSFASKNVDAQLLEQTRMRTHDSTTARSSNDRPGNDRADDQ